MLRLKAVSWLSSAELTGFSRGRALANFRRHGVILGEIGLASETCILLAGGTKIPCPNASSERVAVGPPARGEVQELPFKPSTRWHRRVARDPLEVLFSHKDSANLVDASRPRVTEHLAQFEREHLAVRQGRQLAVRVDQPGNSTNMRVA